MRVRAIAAVALVVALPACGGGEGASSGQPAGAPSSTTPSPSLSPGLDVPGKSASADLSGFTCEPRAGGGDWRASGTLTSPDARSDYRVRVAVTPSAGPAKARQRFVSGVREQKPRAFEFGHVPAGSGDGTCRVQVVRLD